MKLSNLIWVLALAGAATACNSGPPIQGCQIDPETGLCKTQGGGTGGSTGGGGTGGGVAPGCAPVAADFSNSCACCDGEAEGDPTCSDPASLVDCDYGCQALGNTFGFAAVLEVAPDEATTGGGAFDVGFDGFFVVSEAFIEGAEGVVGPLNTAEVLPGATLPVTALSGATGPDVIVTLPEIELDLNADPDGNGVAGPFPLPFVPNSGTFTFAASGTEACFNLSTGITFGLKITDPFVLDVVFACEPANQIDINLEDPILTPEATSGQVCLTIP
jgi:hypothetical protein